MDVRIIVETTAETGKKRTEELRCFSLTDQCHSELGLKLEQGKAILAQLQGSILRHQMKRFPLQAGPVRAVAAPGPFTTTGPGFSTRSLAGFR